MFHPTGSWVRIIATARAILFFGFRYQMLPNPFSLFSKNIPFYARRIRNGEQRLSVVEFLLCVNRVNEEG